MSDRILIVGASHAGVHLAASLRSKGHDGPITLIGEEVHLPYQRPPLTKAFLAGTATSESLRLRSQSFFETARIDLLLGESVESCSLDDSQALTASGLVVPFDRLALATGARPRHLAVPGHDLTGVVHPRDLDDVTHLADLLTSAANAVVIGGGFIGLEAAAVLRGKGLEVTLVEASTRLMGRSVSVEMSDFYADVHKSRGVHVRLNTTVTAVLGHGGVVTGVTLADNTTVLADLVVVGIGVEPRVELAELLGLTVQGGIVVDRSARTSDPRVVAVGDVTVMPHPLEDGAMVRLESVQNATDQAEVAAATLLDTPAEHCNVPWFWSDQFDLKLQMAGAATSYDDVVIRGSMDDNHFTILGYRDGNLVSGESVNSGADFMAVRRALGSGTTFDKAKAADPEIKLKALL